MHNSINHRFTTQRSDIVFVIPVYNHAQKVAEVINGVLAYHLPIIVVDDGSTDDTYNNIKDIQSIQIIRHEINKGKGAALITGFDHASKTAKWAITIDADGQHDPADAIRLIQALPEKGCAIITGMREGMFKKEVPWTSRFGRSFSNFWVQVSGGPKIRDTQSGFRIYPLPEVLSLDAKARRYEYEVEILVHANRNKIPVIEVPINVTYLPGSQRISHFKPFKDFMRNSKTFNRLIFQRIFSRCSHS